MGDTEPEVKKLKKKTNRQLIDDYDYLSNAASVMDCTGLIPSLPETQEELDSYEDLYHYLPHPAAGQKEDPKEKN